MTCPRCATENPDSAKFCSECGASLAAPPAREQRKTVTVLFCDVTGSTALGERVDPEALRSIMARYFETARAAIERHGGTVEKFIGDAVMAVFGVPVVHEDDALRAVRAALELRDAVDVDVRIGVNTGEVVTGGPEKLATGDAVNVGARLEQAAGVGEVLIGERTYALVRDAVDAELLPPVHAKGKSEALTAYRVNVVTGGLKRRDVAPMVGRARELALLQGAFERARTEHACHLFTVLGAAGIGKSRLVAEFLARVRGARVVHGRCLSYGEGITYWPVVEVLKQLGTPIESVLRDGTTPPEIAWSVRKAFEQAALDGPLIVVFDDIQWGESTFLDLIEHVADLSRGAPILLLCMARPELLDVRPGWSGGKLNATSVLLEPLPRDAVDELLRALAGSVDERIREAADGNPLFVEEMVELARATGGDVSMPPTIQALLAARLDSLPPEERAVLERGAVEGQVFHRGAVAALAPDEPHVDTRLVSLVRKELVRPEAAALLHDDAYRFRHLLIRDAAYEALPKSTRIELHERFATWLEEHGADLVELDEIVGYHLEQAVRYAAELGRPRPELAERAADRLAAAGLRAEARSDVTATVNLLERAVALARRPEVLPSLGQALHDAGRIEEAAAVLGDAVEHGPAVASARARAIRAYQNAHAAGARTEASIAEVERAIDELTELGDDAALGEAYVARARLFYWAGRMAEMEAAARVGREHARRAGNVPVERIATERLLTALDYSGAPRSQVIEIAQEELERDRLGRAFRVRALITLGRCYASQGRLDEGAALLDESGRIYAELGNEVHAAAQLQHRAFVEWLRGDWSATEALARESWDRLGALGEVGYRSTSGAVLGVALARLERDAEAEETLGLAEEMSSPDDYVTELWVLIGRTTLALNAGEHALAVRRARAAVELSATRDDSFHLIIARIVLAEALVAAGETEEARGVVDEAVSLAERQESPGYADRARSVLATMAS